MPMTGFWGLGAGLWCREVNPCHRFGRAIGAGQVGTNWRHAYPAHAGFGGYDQAGIGPENHKMMLDHSQQATNMLVSHAPGGLFPGDLDVRPGQIGGMRFYTSGSQYEVWRHTRLIIDGVKGVKGVRGVRGARGPGGHGHS